MPKSLEEVYDAYRGDAAFDHLRTTGIVLVPGDGHRAPNVLIVGEAPGASENTARRPFVGASGRVLRSLIDDVAGLEPEDYFITNVVKYRPPGNRTPEPHEIEASRPYLRCEWKALGCPPVFVAVGGTALRALAPSMPGITRSAGTPVMLPHSDEPRILWPMFHPAYGLRNPDIRPVMERHWEQFGIWYREGEWR